MIRSQDDIYINRVLKGDTEAYAFLVDKYRRMVYAIAYKVVRSKEDAEEVAQDAFLKAYTSLETFKGSSKFTTWLYRITVNLAVSRTRKAKLFTGTIDEYIEDTVGGESAPDGFAALSREQQGIWIRKALEALPPDTSLVMMLFYMEEQSIEEISVITGITAENIKVRLHRGRKSLYSELKKLLRDELEAMI